MILKPPPLAPGDTIAVVAPGSAPPLPEKLEKGIEQLEVRGFRVEKGRSTYDPCGYLCGTDEDRIDELNGFLRRDDVQGIFCIRGGFGALRILPHLDYEAARKHPKLIVGYSDVTALHLAFYARIGLTSVAGPMVAVEWPEPDPATEKFFWDLVGGVAPNPLLGPNGEPLQPIRPGEAVGRLIGGNLTLITRLIGTPYLPNLRGEILFLEEVGEEPYRIDGMLAQLKLTGILDQLGGMIFGGITEWEPKEDRPTLSLDEVIDFYTNDLPYPVARGLTFGHFPVKSSIPIGVRARLAVNSDTAVLSILEPVVANQ
jgi:muramoyltetrapeptide carboxypeptidase